MSTGNNLAIVIMAAGKGTRLKSRRPKVLHKIAGQPLLRHVITAARAIAAPSDIFIITGHQAENVQAAVADTGVRFVNQPEQKGTGHAIQCARQAVEGYENILVLSGDVPLIRPETITRLRDFHLNQHAAMTILTAVPENPFGYGRVLRKQNGQPEVASIVEQKALTPEQLNAPEINSGIYAFQTKALYAHIDELKTANAHAELYLTDMAALLAAAGERVVAIEATDDREVLGANTIAEMMALDADLRQRKVRQLMAEGVTIYRPDTCTVDPEVEVGPDTILEPFVQLLGSTRVGPDCTIRSYSVLENTTLGAAVLVRQGCVLVESTVAQGALLGPYAHLRPGSEIGEKAHVGNFVETKKAKLGAGAKANHLSYIGDAEVGPGTNIGAGVITCNYDGENKHRTTIGSGVFVGSDSTLVAPLIVEDGAYIAAGSCITEDVPAGALALGRSRQTTKEGWATARRKKTLAQ